MNASDYDINFPFGATDSPYSAAHPHRGDDRPCPQGTPVVIGGTIIGYTGATGNVNGPHLHIQEWEVDYPNVRKPQNAFKPGIVINVDADGTQGDGSFGKFISIQTDDGWVDSYCHLSRILVTRGQIIEGEDMATKMSIETARILAYFILGRDNALNGNQDEDLMQNHVGNDLEAEVRRMYQSDEAKAHMARLVELEKSGNSDAAQKLAQIKAIIN